MNNETMRWIKFLSIPSLAVALIGGSIYYGERKEVKNWYYEMSEIRRDAQSGLSTRERVEDLRYEITYRLEDTPWFITKGDVQTAISNLSLIEQGRYNPIQK